ncbi:hypothetical protein ACX9VS_03165 [Weissella paramesenteroides]
MFNQEFKDSKGTTVATCVATLNETIDFHFSIIDRIGYEADKNNIDLQESNFRGRVMQAADIMGIASTMG